MQQEATAHQAANPTQRNKEIQMKRFAKVVLVASLGFAAGSALAAQETNAFVFGATQLQGGLLNSQRMDIAGSINNGTGANVTTRATVFGATQLQGGLLNSQDMKIGTVSNKSSGTYRTNVFVQSATQLQGGLLNSQRMRIGAVE